jgi:hypothetical protein
MCDREVFERDVRQSRERWEMWRVRSWRWRVPPFVTVRVLFMTVAGELCSWVLTIERRFLLQGFGKNRNFFFFKYNTQSNLFFYMTIPFCNKKKNLTLFTVKWYIWAVWKQIDNKYSVQIVITKIYF